MPIQELFNEKYRLPTVLLISSISVLFVPINNDALTYLIRSILSVIFSGVAIGIFIFRMPKKKAAKISIYPIISFPLVLALGLLWIFYYFGFNKQQPLFVADMWFVVLATIGAILALFFTDRKITSLEIRMDCFEQKLNNTTIDYEKVSEQNTEIEILKKIAWTRFELEKAKKELDKLGGKS
ncbi:MAG: hypothetical protein ACREAD_08370 [Nitrosopumilaceae archaeon]